MLDHENFEYEDIAKLNPFYEEYDNFWVPSPVPEATFSSSASSKSISSASLYYVANSFHPIDQSTSPPMTPVSPFDAGSMPEALRVALHSVYQHYPVFETCDDLAHSEIATYDRDSDYSRRHSFVGDPSQFSKSNLLDITSLDGSFDPQALPRKKLFGQNGWLGNSEDLKEPPDKRKSTIFKGIGKKIKQHVGDIAVDVARSTPFNVHGLNGAKILGKPAAPLSLDRSQQAKLYSELELMICFSANNFLVEQYRGGRVSMDSVKKITASWGSKNRPQVVEFQFDQATQRQLILSNLSTLSFHGEASANPILLNSNLRDWKSIIKDMGIRTFCFPDSSIRKHLHDIHNILEMLGAPFQTRVAFENLQMSTLSLMQEELIRDNRRHSTSSVSLLRPISQVVH
ncbi:hypothetical protein PHISCL_05645 [Aspergillus sclerotialis]|uniref:Uncharacterized protein n=1 Tax=Aspergillus sclerotialis TaxID=2070753 RepID=A0A3A2ZHM3_9EURO|nr:hypothetical protein PHISCL_05645 [Aspergillus sclerotialis]